MSRPAGTWDLGDRRADRVAERLTEVAARFSPPPDALARIEASVMAEFERALRAPAPAITDAAALLSAPDDATSAAPLPMARVGLPERLRGAFSVAAYRRVLAVGLAAALALASVAVVLGETGPGQPLYRLRLQIESLGLPSIGSQARLQAQIDRSGQRLAELTAAGESGDVAATDDSASAYLEALQGLIDGGTDRAGDLAALLARHEAVLTHVAAVVPAAARSAVARVAAAVKQAEVRLARPESSRPGPPARAVDSAPGGVTQGASSADLGPYANAADPGGATGTDKPGRGEEHPGG